MSILDNTAIFLAVIKQGGFSHAAKYLGLSNGLISRRIVLLESELGVTLIKRTTRQLQLTPEGDLFYQHAERIQEELNDAINFIHSSTHKPAGTIRVSAPLFLGRHYLTPLFIKFLKKHEEIKIELDLSNERHDLIKEHFDLVFRGAGYLDPEYLRTNNLRMKLLIKDEIRLYASPNYLKIHKEPKSIDELSKHTIISYIGNKRFLEQDKWKYKYKGKENEITVMPKFRFNDIECGLISCTQGFGIGKFNNLVAKNAVSQGTLKPILTQYNWGMHNLFAVYSNQKHLPQRTRLLLDFIYKKISDINK